MVQILLLRLELLFSVLCVTPEIPPPPPFFFFFFFFESIRFVQHLTHCPGWLSQTWKAKAEMLSLMPDTWCRFGGDCTTGTVLPLSHPRKSLRYFLSCSRLCLFLLCFATQLSSLCKSQPLCWDYCEKLCTYHSDTQYLDLLRHFFFPIKIVNWAQLMSVYTSSEQLIDAHN